MRRNEISRATWVAGVGLRRQPTGGDETPVSIVTGLAKIFVERGKTGALERLSHGLGMDADNLPLGIQNQGPVTCLLRIIGVARLHRICTNSPQIAMDRRLVRVSEQPLNPGWKGIDAGIVLGVVGFNCAPDFIAAEQQVGLLFTPLFIAEQVRTGACCQRSCSHRKKQTVVGKTGLVRQATSLHSVFHPGAGLARRFAHPECRIPKFRWA